MENVMGVLTVLPGNLLNIDVIFTSWLENRDNFSF